MPRKVWVSETGALVAFAQSPTPEEKRFLASASGGSIEELPIAEGVIVGFYDGDRKLLAIDGATGGLVEIQTASPSTLVPLFSPVLMFMRVCVETPPFWQIGLSWLLMGISIWLSARLAGKLFRVGILMYGQAPTWATIARALRS